MKNYAAKICKKQLAAGNYTFVNRYYDFKNMLHKTCETNEWELCFHS